MKFLSAPWRWKFLTRSDKEKGCVFCDAQKAPDKKSLICFRGEKFFVILNKYPYTSGHLMIVPYNHLKSPESIDDKQSPELWSLLNRSIQVLKKNFNPQGFNIGMNLGEVAGAGVKDHFHLHIVPRWKGDSNFMAVTGNTEVISYDINEIYKIVSKGFHE